jgi:hypothetical protein
VWMGDAGLAAALSRRAIELEGPEHLVRSFPKWFGLHAFANVERPASRARHLRAPQRGRAKPRLPESSSRVPAGTSART